MAHLSSQEQVRLDELLSRCAAECTNALQDLEDQSQERKGQRMIADETIYELDGAVTDLFEFLNASGIADRAAFKR